MDDVPLSFKDSTTFRIGAGPRDTALCRQVPGTRAGKLDMTQGSVEWTCPATWYHAIVLRSVFKDRLVLDDAVIAWGEKQFEWENYRRSIKNAAVADGGLLYRFQKPAVNWLFDDQSLLAFDMGLGKTVIALQALEFRRKRDRGMRDALVVTTSSMKYTWANEAERWAPSWADSVVVVDGTADKRKKQISSAPPGTLFIINWESLRKHTRLAGYGSIALSDEDKAEKEFNRRAITYVVADEAHRAKDPHSKQTRALWWVLDRARYRWPMTGTPAQEPLDLWAMLRLAQPTWFGSRQDFRDRYVFGVETQWGFEAIGFRPENKAELDRFVDLIMFRTSKEEALDLPEKTYVRRLIDLTPKQRTAYRAMKKELLVEIGDQQLTAASPLVKLGRLSQIASAMPVLESHEGIDPETGQPKIITEVVALEDPSNKISALLEILDEGTDHVVVFAVSKKLINLAERALDKKGISYVRVTGDESAELRSIHVQQFQEGQARVCLCTVGAGSEGITLTRASTAVFLQRPWSLVQSRQAEDRIHRIGQDANVVTIIDLVSKDTVDVEVYKALVEKGETLESVVRDRDRIKELLGE